MGEFHRNPSKVWWGGDSQNWGVRSASASPGSQDSGFSDTEASPPAPQQSPARQSDTPRRQVLQQDVARDIMKSNTSEDCKNLTGNFKEKTTPKKSLRLLHLARTSPGRHSSYNPGELTPVNEAELVVRSEPVKKHRYQRNNSLKVSRSLFGTFPRSKIPADQYAEDEMALELRHASSNGSSTFEDSEEWDFEDGELPEVTRTFPLIYEAEDHHRENRSAPAVLINTDSSFTREHYLSSSDCDSELESVFNPPQHTSTPKASACEAERMRNRHKRLLKQSAANKSGRNSALKQKFNKQFPAARKWLEELHDLYEPECMTTLQCKSLAGDLLQKTGYLASKITAGLKQALVDSEVIKREFDNNQNQEGPTGPPIQSLASLIIEFCRTHQVEDADKLLAVCDDIRTSPPSDLSGALHQLSPHWGKAQQQTLVRETKKLVEYLADPHSELHLRATLTGTISLALKHELLIDYLVRLDAINALCVLCEKCEGSSIRSLILRALATLCSNVAAVRRFEKASGIRIIAEVLVQEDRPEPERSEAVALLAQITAPWIEDNQSVQGLAEYAKDLIKAITKFTSSTKCCQNLLLCAAALANLTSIDSRCTKYVLFYDSVRLLLRALKSRGQKTSVYLIEQVASLLANLSASKEARDVLTEEKVPVILLHFVSEGLKGHVDEDAEIRLQQKSVIALSRLCSSRDAAEQTVEHDGVNRLVRLCRNKNARFDNDAVLVAALATLRKIIDICGNSVISAEDAQELVEPKLLDSFIAYSAQNESYV